MKKQPQENAITNGDRASALSGDVIRNHYDRFACAHRFYWGGYGGYGPQKPRRDRK